MLKYILSFTACITMNIHGCQQEKITVDYSNKSYKNKVQCKSLAHAATLAINPKYSKYYRTNIIAVGSDSSPCCLYKGPGETSGPYQLDLIDSQNITHTGNAGLFFADDNTLCSINSNGSVELSLATNTTFSSLASFPFSPNEIMAFCTTNYKKTLYIGSNGNTTYAGELDTHTFTFNNIHAYAGLSNAAPSHISSLALSDENNLITATHAGNLFHFDTETRKLKGLHSVDYPLHTVIDNKKNSSIVYTGGDSENICTWDLRSPDKLRLTIQDGMKPYTLALLKGYMVVGAANNWIKIYDLRFLASAVQILKINPDTATHDIHVKALNKIDSMGNIVALSSDETLSYWSTWNL